MFGSLGRNNLAARGGLVIKLIAALVVIIAGDYIFWQKNEFGSGFGFFAGALLCSVIVARAGLVRHRLAWGAGAVALATVAAMLFDPGLLALLLFLTAIAVMTLVPIAAKGGDGWQWFQRLAYHGIRSLVTPLIDFFTWAKLRKSKRRGGKGSGFARHLPALILPIVGSVGFLTLFAAANPVLEEWLLRIEFPALDEILVAHAIFWVALFWLAWSFLRPALPARIAATADGRGDVKIPGVTLPSLRLSLVAFNLVFLLQNGMDLIYLSGAATLPDGMTLAEYAHRGAYPLIVTALLAGLFTLITLRPGSTSARDPLIRRLLVLWIAQNIFLVGSSIERTLDYVGVYSLTQWRIAALVWMALVAVGLVLICWRMLRDKHASWLINTNLLAAGAVLLAYCFVDTGAIAAQWNVRHAKEVGGKGAALDLCYLNELGASALLPLVELEGRDGLDPAFRNRVKVVRHAVQARTARHQADYFWTWRNAGRLAVAERLRGKIVQDWAASGFACDGSLIPVSPPQMAPAEAPESAKGKANRPPPPPPPPGVVASSKAVPAPGPVPSPDEMRTQQTSPSPASPSRPEKEPRHVSR